jgi:catechol 2,3-dioxygenase-like lactoylglutathione lyase family enzyme
VALVDTERCHRIAVVVDDVDAMESWLTGTLGAGGTVSEHRGASAGGGEHDDLAGTNSRMVGLGGFPFIALSGGVDGGPVARHRQRYGPSFHSLAWEVSDLWSTEHHLRRADIRIAAVNVPGRHFFMHPKDTHGLLLEWTDDVIRAEEASRDVGPLQVQRIAWISAAVEDPPRTAELLTMLAGATEVHGLPRAPDDVEEIIDMTVGDIVVRLVSPRSGDSRFAEVLEHGPRLWSCAFAVADLDRATAALEQSGSEVIERWPGLAVTDPKSTFGVPFEWTAA